MCEHLPSPSRLARCSWAVGAACAPTFRSPSGWSFAWFFPASSGAVVRRLARRLARVLGVRVSVRFVRVRAWCFWRVSVPCAPTLVAVAGGPRAVLAAAWLSATPIGALSLPFAAVAALEVQR